MSTFRYDPAMDHDEYFKQQGADGALQQNEIFTRYPSLSIGSALGDMGVSRTSPFGSFLVNNLGQHMNTMFQSLTGVGNESGPGAAVQFYKDYTRGLFDSANPLNFNYQEVGSHLRDTLTGASGSELAAALAESVDPKEEMDIIMSFVQGFGAQTMSRTKLSLMSSKLTDMLFDYMENPSLMSQGVNFSQYLVDNAAGFLSYFWGGGSSPNPNALAGDQ